MRKYFKLNVVAHLEYQLACGTPPSGQVSALLPTNACLTISHKALHLAYLVSQLLILAELTLNMSLLPAMSCRRGAVILLLDVPFNLVSDNRI